MCSKPNVPSYVVITHARPLDYLHDYVSLPREYGKETLEDLFIAVAKEPLTLGGNET